MQEGDMDEMETSANRPLTPVPWTDEMHMLELYNEVYWPKLRKFIVSALENNGQKQSNLQSFEELYSCVYKCMHNRQAELLYNQLIALLTTHVQEISTELCIAAKECSDLSSKCNYIVKFSTSLKMYGRALQGFVPLFNYLNRVYVKPMFDVNLEEQLLDIFKTLIVGPHFHHVIEAMIEVRKIPFAVDPSVMSELISSLYAMKLELRCEEKELFSLYIPNTKAPSLSTDLQGDIEATKQLQFKLQEEAEFRRSNCGKRSSEQLRVEDEECQSSMISSLLSGFQK